MISCLDVDPQGLTAPELNDLLVALDAMRNRVEAAASKVTALWNDGQVWAADGALTGAAGLRRLLGVSSSSARAHLRVAQRLRSMPATQAAFEAGELSWEKVRWLADIRTDAIASLFERDEELLVGLGRTMAGDQFRQALRYWKAIADDHCSDDDGPDGDPRYASMSEVLDGKVKFDALLESEAGQFVKHVLDGIYEELYQADLLAAEQGVPVRTARQRRADAFEEMARRAASADADTARRSKPDVIVTMSLAALEGASGAAGQLDNGAVVSGAAARRLACDASIVRCVTNGASEILDLGRSTPTPSSAQRRAVFARDRTCTFAGCEMQRGWCDVHHLVPYQRGRDTGGPTDLTNLTLVCGRHHRLVHEGGFGLSRNPHTGQIETRRPDGTVIPDRPRTTPINPLPFDQAPAPDQSTNQTTTDAPQAQRPTPGRPDDAANPGVGGDLGRDCEASVEAEPSVSDRLDDGGHPDDAGRLGVEGEPEAPARPRPPTSGRTGAGAGDRGGPADRSARDGPHRRSPDAPPGPP